MTKPPLNDPQNIWQGQSSERTTMSFNEFQERLRRVQSISRRQSLRSLAIGLAVLIFFVSALMRTEAPLAQFALGLFIIGVLAAVLPHVVTLWKGAQQRNPASDMALTTSIQFYRRLLEPQRIYERGVAVFLLLAFVGMLLLIIPVVARQIEDPNSRISLRPWVPFLVILLGWGVAFLTVRRRQQRWVRRELELLSTLEKEN
jgi:uncharacterized membrane protein